MNSYHLEQKMACHMTDTSLPLIVLPDDIVDGEWNHNPYESPVLDHKLFVPGVISTET
jgi:hypothetical protein